MEEGGATGGQGVEPNVLLLEDFTESERSESSGSSRAAPHRPRPPLSSLNFTHGRSLSEA